MSSGDEVFRRIQSAARSAAAKTGIRAPTQEYLIRHTLESFLDRLTHTAHAEDFVLKGGILLAAYGVRRPTKDADANAVGADVNADHLISVVHDIAAVQTDDGVVFDLDSISVQEIRERADHPGFRVRVGVLIGPWQGTAAWDVSTGDPIVPNWRLSARQTSTSRWHWWQPAWIPCSATATLHALARSAHPLPASVGTRAAGDQPETSAGDGRSWPRSSSSAASTRTIQNAGAYLVSTTEAISTTPSGDCCMG